MSMSKRKGKKEEEKEADKAGDKAADAKETKEKDKKEGKGEAKSPKTKKKGEEDGKEEGAKETKDKDKKEGKDKKKEGEDKEEVEAPKDDKDKDKESITTSGKKKSKSGKEEVKKEDTKKDEKKSKTKSRDDEKVARKDTKGKGKKDVEEEPEEEAKEEEEEEVVEQKPYDADSSVYVHRDGVVFVYEKRDVKVGDDKAVVIKELPASLVPSSLHFRSLSDPAASLSEQTFLDGSQSLSQLLAESRGKQVAIRLQKAGSASIQGKVVEVAADDVSILREDDDAVVVIPRALIAFIEVSNKAVDTSPTLRAVLDTETPGEHKVELTYGAEGVTWSADYSLLLLSKTEAEVTGWYTVNNRSGKDFHNTAFTVVAEVSGYTPPPKHKTGVIGTIWSKTSSVLSPRESEGSHRGVRKEQVKYYLPRPLTIGGHETKQVRLVSGKVPVTTANFFNGSPYHYTAGTTVTTSANPVNKVLQPVVRFENSKTVHPSLGVVLPAGSLDVFQRTHGGTFLDLVYQYHTERAHPGDTLNCIIGPEKPWLTAERKSVEFKHDNKRHVMTETVQIEIRNRSNKGEDVLVEESLYRAKEYQITHATPKPTTDVKDSHVLLWQLRVKRESTAVIKYQVVYNNVPN